MIFKNLFSMGLVLFKFYFFAYTENQLSSHLCHVCISNIRNAYLLRSQLFLHVSILKPSVMYLLIFYKC